MTARSPLTADRSPILFEACVSTVAEAIEAERAGAGRLELCDWRFEGGATPSAELIAQVTASVRIPVRVLIRPRDGDYVYDEDEVQAMLAEIEVAKTAGAAGIVSGALHRDGTVDQITLARLVSNGRPLRFTFHRAMDETERAMEALEVLVRLGVDRVLTSGHGRTAEEGILTLKQLVWCAEGRIAIMACGGIRGHNVRKIVAATGVSEVHARADYAAITDALRIADSG